MFVFFPSISLWSLDKFIIFLTQRAALKVIIPLFHGLQQLYRNSTALTSFSYNPAPSVQDSRSHAARTHNATCLAPRVDTVCAREKAAFKWIIWDPDLALSWLMLRVKLLRALLAPHAAVQHFASHQAHVSSFNRLDAETAFDSKHSIFN